MAGPDIIHMKLTIFQRLTAGYLAIMFMTLSFGGYTAFQLNGLTHIMHGAAGVDSDAITLTESLSTRLYVMLALEKKFWISGDEDFFRLFVKRQSEFQEQLNDLARLISDKTSVESLQTLQRLNLQYLNKVETLASRHKDQITPSENNNQGQDTMIHTMSILLNQIHQAVNTARHDKILRSESIGTRVLWVAIGFAIACLFVGLAVSFLTTRSIVHPMVELRNKTRDIASGHFVPIKNMKSPPEIRNLADDFNVMSEKLNELDILKEDFISHLSHALRTPLTSIWEASGMLISGTFDRDPTSRHQLLNIVRDECSRLIESVNRILDLSRMEAGMMDYRFTELDLNDLVRSAMVKLGPIAKAKNIQMDFEPQPDLPWVMADPETLHQLLENVIGNALKFTDPGGSVTLNSRFEVGSGGRVRVSVKDTGCGIENEYLEHIFEKFRKIEKKKNTARGTGLGLSIAKHIVEAHGGNIWVESEENQGSTFYFSLPRA